LSLWSSGFRPFFLLAAIYGPLSLPLIWTAPLLHGHEMLFGFAAALVCGVVLTALPSWSGTAELRGAPLATLAGLWLAGRVAILGAQWLPPLLVIVLDSALLPALLIFLFSTITKARKTLFWWTLPPLAVFAAANFVFHFSNAHWGLLLGVHALALLFTLYGGLFIPAFTRRYLQARGERSGAILMPLEYATAAAMVVFAVSDLLNLSSVVTISAALLAAAVHAIRFARWRGWRTGGEPLLWCIHLGYAWLIAALILRAAAELTPRVPREAWVHAFTIGAYGMLKIGLMTRVALRHTGRALHAPPAMRAAFLMVLGGALLRLAYSVHGLGEWLLAASALLWGAAFVVYLSLYAPMLLQPSLPRT